jgi:hypothetical protein
MKRLLLLILALLLCSSALAESVALPRYRLIFINEGGYSTELVAVNHREEAVLLAPWPGAMPASLAPGEARHWTGWYDNGGGTRELVTDYGVSAHTIITDPNGAIFVAKPLLGLSLEQRARILDPLTRPGFTNYVFFAAGEAGAVARLTDDAGSRDFYLSPGEVRIETISGPASLESVRPQFGAPGFTTGGEIFATAFAGQEARCGAVTALELVRY